MHHFASLALQVLCSDSATINIHNNGGDNNQKHSKNRNNDLQDEWVESRQLLHSKSRCGTGDVGRGRNVAAVVVGLDGEVVGGST